jgi:hypothetical protein
MLGRVYKRAVPTPRAGRAGHAETPFAEPTMTETPWGDEEPPPKKKSVPTWVWFCGGGCLLALVLLAAGGFMLFGFIKNTMDPEQAWPKLNAILPFDERPPELKMLAGLDMSLVGQQQFTLVDARGFMAQFMLVKGKQGNKMREDMFASETPKLTGNMGTIEFEDVQRGTIDVQGRTLRVVRMKIGLGWIKKIMPDEEAEKGMGAAVYVDLEPEGQDGMFWLQYTRQDPKGGPITDEELQRFFKPFHVGPNR